jgi:hypothetical protein
MVDTPILKAQRNHLTHTNQRQNDGSYDVLRQGDILPSQFDNAILTVLFQLNLRRLAGHGPRILIQNGRKSCGRHNRQKGSTGHSKIRCSCPKEDGSSEKSDLIIKKEKCEETVFFSSEILL